MLLLLLLGDMSGREHACVPSTAETNASDKGAKERGNAEKHYSVDSIFT